MVELKLEKFEPNTYVELTDGMKGFRKLGLVTEGGDMYFDDAGAGTKATPLPIYSYLQPKAVGNLLSWGLELANANADQHTRFVALTEKLLGDSGVDTITAGRALYWAFINRDFDYVKARAAGVAATKQVRESRAVMDRLIEKGATAAA